MKTKKPKENLFPQIVEALKDIKSLSPDGPICSHLSVIVEEYGDIWGISDKEFLFALTKYKAQIQMDYPHMETEEKELQKIIKDGMNLSLSSLQDDDFDEQI